MIIKSIAETVVYRACAPKYMGHASSFAGSLKAPGRFNRAGSPALYVAFDPFTAYNEYQQGLAVHRPVVIVSMKVKTSSIVDLSKGYVPGTWEPHWQDGLHGTWRMEIAKAKAAGKTPKCAGWKCGADAQSHKAVGIKFPSQARAGGQNLVLFPHKFVFGVDKVEDLDPHKEISEALKIIAFEAQKAAKLKKP